MKQEKIYIITDNSVWNDEELNKIIFATTSKEQALKELKEYVQQVKWEVDFDKLDFAKDDYGDGFIVEEDDNSFSLYENGEYNSYHIDISIIEQELITDFNYEKNSEYDELIKKYNVPIKDGIKDAIDTVTSLQAREVTDFSKEYNELEFLKVNLYNQYVDNYINKKRNLIKNKVYVVYSEESYYGDRSINIILATPNLEIAENKYKEECNKIKSNLNGLNDYFLDEDIDEHYFNYQDSEECKSLYLGETEFQLDRNIENDGLEI